MIHRTNLRNWVNLSIGDFCEPVLFNRVDVAIFNEWWLLSEQIVDAVRIDLMARQKE